MKTHELKCWSESFVGIVDGKKRFEYRKDDRQYEVGDLLQLKEFVPCMTCGGTGKMWDNGDKIYCCDDGGKYTGREILVNVTWILDSRSFGVPDGYCVMSIENVKTDNDAEFTSIHDCLTCHVRLSSREIKTHRHILDGGKYTTLPRETIISNIGAAIEVKEIHLTDSER